MRRRKIPALLLAVLLGLLGTACDENEDGVEQEVEEGVEEVEEEVGDD